MDHLKDLMQNTQIAAPCSVKWDDMTGDDRARLCAKCDLHVVNTFMLTDEEVLNILTRVHKGDQICIRVHKRADGTYMTRNCPVGVQKIRERAYRVATWIAGGLSVMLSLAANALPASGGKQLKKKPVWHATVKSTDCGSQKAKAKPGGTGGLKLPELPQILGGLPALPGSYPTEVPAIQKPVVVQPGVVQPGVIQPVPVPTAETAPAVISKDELLRSKGVVQITPASNSANSDKNSKAK